MVVTAQLIEAACRARDGDTHGTRTHIARRRIVGESPSSWRQTRHGAIEERVTELVYPGTAKPMAVEQVACSRTL
jgi:hypothetical protein